MTRFIATLALVCVASIPAHAKTCIASQYSVGDGYHGKRAANGSIFNTYATSPYTVAHKSKPFGAVLTITNLGNGRVIQARVTDPVVRSSGAAVWTSEGQVRTLLVWAVRRGCPSNDGSCRRDETRTVFRVPRHQRAGHYLQEGRKTIWDPPPECSFWNLGLMDSGLLKNGRHPDVVDGRVWWTCGARPDLWYAFFWWDDTGDRRPGSNSGFTRVTG